MDNNKLLEQIGNLIDQKLAPIKEDTKELREGQKRLERTTVKKTDLKSFIDTLTPVIEKRAERTELFVKAEIKGVKEDLQTEILASRAAAHENMEKLGSKICKKELEQDIRLDNLKKHTTTP